MRKMDQLLGARIPVEAGKEGDGSSVPAKVIRFMRPATGVGIRTEQSRSTDPTSFS